MKLTTGAPVVAVSGTTANSQMVHYELKGQIVARAKVIPHNPDTVEQRRVREQTRLASEAWDGLSDQLWAAWEEWAKTWGSLPTSTGEVKRPTGRNIYVSAAQYLLRLGLQAPQQPPVPLPRPQIIAAEELGSADPHQFRFRVITATLPSTLESTLPEIAVFVRITPQTGKRARAPYPKDLRYICGAGAGSAAVLLPQTENIVVFEGARYGVEPGQRFGFQLTPVRLADGVAGQPLFFNATRNPAPLP